MEGVSRQANSPMRLTQHTTVDQLWQRVSETIARMQKVHATVLSVPTLLKVVQECNEGSTNSNRELIATVDDLKRALGLELDKPQQVPVTIVQSTAPKTVTRQRHNFNGANE